MRLATGSYGPLVIGGVGAIAIIFAEPLGRLIHAVFDIAGVSVVVMIPAMVLILLALLAHQQGRQAEKDAEVQQNAEAMADDARRAEERARELEHLVHLGEALGATLDPKAIHRTVTQYLQPVIGQREIWMTVQTDDWRLALGAPRDADAPTDQPWDPTQRPGAWDTFPMFAGGKLVGLMGVGQAVGDRPQPLSDSQRRLLEMTSSLVGLSIKNAQLFRQVRQLSAIDVLTGCLTRQHGMNLISAELRRAQRSEQPVSLIFIDLDHFKQLNDRYGHLFGDTVLAAVGTAMKEALRGSDLRCRYGGEEFVVLLPETPLEGAKRVAESLRRHLARKAIKRPEGSVFVTASLGVSTALPGELDAKALLSRADAAMYRAKRDGRNSVRVWEDYPEWRRSQVRDEPTRPDEGDSDGSGVGEPPRDWKLLVDGMEGAVGREPSGSKADEWDDV